MPMDLFEAHLRFSKLLKRLDATQGSIQQVVAFALEYHSTCGEDFWETVLQECRTGSTNMRINLLYFLDSLCEASAQSASNQRSKPSSSTKPVGPGLYYVNLLQKDLSSIIEWVVPESRDGLINVQSAMQAKNWRMKRILDPKKVEAVIASLQERRASIQAINAQNPSNGIKSSHERISRSQAMRRIEEDRERHKLLRERRWVQRVDRSDSTQPTLAVLLPNSLPPIAVSKSMPPTPSDAMDTDETARAGSDSRPQNSPQLAIDIEFENAWETTSDWNEDDIDAVYEEYMLCFPGTAPKKPLP
ncbi:SubName: Full=Uncharacterized protein {ECO:0000313/EMBL:CCA68504.1} [Serendipita indica DSM 11827]|nr:SubName: Full=Uncharacterized protein {ECO:0000313/EMBL:CCA68504.1} [Serendipita indica DSM 11827]